MEAMYVAANVKTDIHRFAVDFKLVDRNYMAKKERHIKKGNQGSYPEPEIYNIAATAAFRMNEIPGITSGREVKVVWRFSVKDP